MTCCYLQATIKRPSTPLLRTKALKLWKFELDDNDWQAVEDLVSVLSVCYGLHTCCVTHIPLAVQKSHTLLLELQGVHHSNNPGHGHA